MKKNKLIFLLTLILIFMFSITSYANFKTVYAQNKPINIYVRNHHGTILEFKSSIEYVLNDEQTYFKVEQDSSGTKLVIQPQAEQKASEIKVYTEDGEKYIFRLIETNKEEPFSIVEVKPGIKLGYEKLLKMTNEKRISIDPAVLKVVDIYDIKKRIYTADGLDIMMKRLVTVKNKNKTVFWFRVQNSTEQSLNIPPNRVDIKGEDKFAVALEKFEGDLKPNEVMDIYYIANGISKEDTINLVFTVNGTRRKVKLGNIPYEQEEFDVFVKESGQVLNLELNNYQE